MTQQLANAAQDTEGWVEESMVALDRWGALLNTPSSLGSRPTDAGQKPPHYLPVRIATGRDSLHRLFSEGLGLLFGLSLVLRKRHPFADDFSPRLVFRLHAQDPLL